jgi:ATP-dependent helicase/nuclease subunit A
LQQPDGVPYLVSGQIDRLVVSDAAVLIVDFKTNQTPPRNESEVPVTYLRQLALYRAVLALLYPAKPIRAALLWTEAPEMMEISSVALDRELARIMST